MKTSDLAVLLGIAISCSLFAATVAEAAQPNIVMLLADDLGYQDVGCYDGPVKTPAIDGLAEKGVRFTDFYSGCAVCSPSRATLMTGRHHIRAGVYSWIHDASQNSHLLEREVTLAEILKKNGYSTAHIGKWHLGLPTGERKKPTPDKHGFDHWFATWNNAEPSHRNPHNFIRNGKPVGTLEGYSCQLVADEAIDWLNNRRDKAAIYSGTIDNTDRAIARILKKLAKIDDPSNTLIIYASDNGSYRDDRTGGLRGRKGLNWEGGIRVPGLFSWPGTIDQGVEATNPAGLVDVLPTVCGLLGLQTPEGVHLDGSDLSSILTGNKGKFKRHQPLFWHLQKSRPVVAMRDGQYSLVADPDYELSTSNMFQEAWIPKVKTGGYKKFQLFDLAADPKQTTNIADKHPELLARLKVKMLEINASIMSDGHDWHLKK
jgi:arylsulfatase A